MLLHSILYKIIFSLKLTAELTADAFAHKYTNETGSNKLYLGLNQAMWSWKMRLLLSLA